MSESQIPKPPKTLSVSGIPHAIWVKLHNNANVSDLSLRDYLIKLLDVSRPFDHPGDRSNADNSKAQMATEVVEGGSCVSVI